MAPAATALSQTASGSGTSRCSLTPAGRGWFGAAAKLGKVVVEQQGSTVDRQACVHQALAVVGQAAQFLLRAEGIPVEPDRLLAAPARDRQVRRDAALVLLLNVSSPRFGFCDESNRRGPPSTLLGQGCLSAITRLRARASLTRDSSAGLAKRAARAGWTCPR
jgi:hypothetical protein